MFLFHPPLPLSHPCTFTKQSFTAVSPQCPPVPSLILSLRTPSCPLPPTKSSVPSLIHSPTSPSVLSTPLKSLIYTLFTLPFPSFAQDLPPVSDQDDPITQILFKIVLVLLLYATFSVIFITIDNILTARRVRVDRDIVLQKLAEDPNRKLMIDDKPPKKKPPKTTSNNASTFGNRQSRRQEKKVKEREQRALKRKQSRQQQSATSESDTSKTS